MLLSSTVLDFSKQERLQRLNSVLKTACACGIGCIFINGTLDVIQAFEQTYEAQENTIRLSQLPKNAEAWSRIANYKLQDIPNVKQRLLDELKGSSKKLKNASLTFDELSGTPSVNLVFQD
jgi:hypothetical protein